MQPTLPVPHDLPLDLPASALLLKALLVIFFIGHILFVNLLLGSTALTALFEYLGMKRNDRRYDDLAHEIAATITLNKSIAVVLGVGPLLGLNVVYTMYIYSANALTGNAWISIIPLAIFAFLLLYLHKYTWERFQQQKRLHLSIVCTALTFLLIIPLIFLANINLMLFPSKWTEVSGFISALMLPNVWPRYFHFLLASLSATGLFCAWYFGRPQTAEIVGFNKPELRRMFYWITFYATLAQFAAGPLVLFTLPAVGLSRMMVGVIICGATLGFIATMFLWGEIHESDQTIGRGFWIVVSLFAATVAYMATGRHLYREGALYDHREQVAAKTREFVKESEVANLAWQAELAKYPADERLFQKNCSACHALDSVKVGPPLRELASVYKDNQEGIVRWAMAPGKKRPTFPKMPSMKHVGENNLREIAKYILRVASALPPTASQQSYNDAVQKKDE